MSIRNHPVSTRVKNGRSGNPSGRPRQKLSEVSAASLFRKVAKEHIRLEINGKTGRLPRWEAYVRQIYTMALNKDNGAARLLDQLQRQFPGDAPPGDPITLQIIETDARL